MLGLRSDVSALAGGALVACVIVVVGAVVAGAVGRGVAEWGDGYEA
jgi:hypothetical protein